MMEVSNIIKGWKNYITNNKDVEELANKRALICAKCPFKENSKIFKWVKDDIEEVNGTVCGLCKCPIAMLVRSDKQCKKNKWEHIN